ncbi:MAG: 2-C-methyl-D-erythritol 2,4-cyclodiphosphate synthase [Gammaproteobacteria bacterium]|jgi:2-C-methyl-D-erythritol 2,4-cyclodiphosphate synthase|nr:2-C-methyl-D-erythritol 2,4-cyclodiphosphate synthase [Gammaproteobacteria bacterium]MBT6044198.1 2-C-methyl-D-erythritol 2,4-cyclodiphosphate synthase [Gammaproteobacteria bacterium]
MSNLRIGNGIDVHRFAEQADSANAITLGGVSIPHDYCLVAHSDGDVLIHALIDAILGALALGDIGQHFPDTDIRYKNISSLALLKDVLAMMQNKNWKLVNADITLVAQAPKLSPYILQIRESLSAELEVDADQISVKATTSEGLGFTGRQEGIAAYATVLLEKL